MQPPSWVAVRSMPLRPCRGMRFSSRLRRSGVFRGPPVLNFRGIAVRSWASSLQIRIPTTRWILGCARLFDRPRQVLTPEGCNFALSEFVSDLPDPAVSALRQKRPRCAGSFRRVARYDVSRRYPRVLGDAFEVARFFSGRPFSGDVWRVSGRPSTPPLVRAPVAAGLSKLEQIVSPEAHDRSYGNIPVQPCEKSRSWGPITSTWGGVIGERGGADLGPYAVLNGA